MLTFGNHDTFANVTNTTILQLLKFEWKVSQAGHNYLTKHQ